VSLEKEGVERREALPVSVRAAPLAKRGRLSALVGFGLVVLMFFFAARRQAAATWPSVRGKIVRSELEEYQERYEDEGRTRWRTAYCPAVEYAYAVHGIEYQGNQISYGMTRPRLRSRRWNCRVARPGSSWRSPLSSSHSPPCCWAFSVSAGGS
jgi:hypothetical protein